MNLFKTEAHTLEDLKTDLQTDEMMNFIPLMKRHHDYLEESIGVILSKEATENEKQSHLGRFLHILTMHAHAEEETLYVGLKSNSDKLARVEGTASQAEHDIAGQLADELKEMGCETTWSEAIEAKAQVLAGLVKNHIKEEESEIFKIAKKDIPADQMNELRDEYIQKCKTYLDIEMRDDSHVRARDQFQQSNFYR